MKWAKIVITYHCLHIWSVARRVDFNQDLEDISKERWVLIDGDVSFSKSVCFWLYYEKHDFLWQPLRQMDDEETTSAPVDLQERSADTATMSPARFYQNPHTQRMWVIIFIY